MKIDLYWVLVEGGGWLTLRAYKAVIGMHLWAIHDWSFVYFSPPLVDENCDRNVLYIIIIIGPTAAWARHV